MTHCCPYETTYNRPVYFKFSRLCCANVGILNKLQKSVWPEVRGGNLYFNDWVVKKNHLWAAACCGSRQETLFANETTFCSQNFVSPLLYIRSVKLYVSCALIMLAKNQFARFPWNCSPWNKQCLPLWAKDICKIKYFISSVMHR